MINIVLAAGYATRLYPLTENFPKALLQVGNGTILDHLLRDIDRHPAVTGHVIISNHRFIEHFSRWRDSVSAEFKPIVLIDDGSMCNEDRLGAVRDLQLALSCISDREDVLVMAGDNMLNFSLCEFIDFALEKHTSCVTCYREGDLRRQQRTAIIETDETDRILSYEEKPQAPKNDLAVPPFYYYRANDAAKIARALEEGCHADAPGGFAAWLSQQATMHAWRFRDGYRRYDIGNMESYEEAKRVFSQP